MGVGNIGTTCECPKPENVNGSGYGRDRPERLPSAAVTPLLPETRGGLDRKNVRQVVRRHRRELFACYPVAARQRNVGGLVALDFTIASSGKVRAVALRHQTLGDDQIARCFVEAVGAWQFPHPLRGQEAVVAQKFLLVPRPGPLPARPRGHIK